MVNITFSKNEKEIKTYELFISKNKKRGTQLVVTNRRLIFNSFNEKHKVYGAFSIPLESINGSICISIVKTIPAWLVLVLVILCLYIVTIPLAIYLWYRLRPNKGIIIIGHNLSQKNIVISNKNKKILLNQYFVPRVLPGKDYNLVLSELDALIEDIKNGNI